MRQTAKILFLCILGILLTFSLSSAQLRGPLVVSERWPECTDLFTWSRDIFRLDGVTDSSERDRAISFFNWLRLYNRLCEGVGGMNHAIEGAWGEEKYVHDLHKHMFVYGWGHCGTHSMVAEGFWQEYMQDSLAADRVICMHENGGFHTMYRLRMDGHFGAFDARYGYYLLEKDTPDARILDWEGVGDDRNVWANMKYTNRCRPFIEFPQKELERVLWVKPKKVFESEAAWRAAGTEPEAVFRNRHYRMGTKFHDMRFSLPRGTTIERWWDNRMKKWYVPEKNKDMFLPEGRFYRVGASMVGGDGEKNDPNWKYMKPYLTRVPEGLGYPEYLEGDLSLGQAWGKISYNPVLSRGDLEELKLTGSGLETSPEPPYLRPARDTGQGEWISSSTARISWWMVSSPANSPVGRTTSLRSLSAARFRKTGTSRKMTNGSPGKRWPASPAVSWSLSIAPMQPSGRVRFTVHTAGNCASVSPQAPRARTQQKKLLRPV